MTLGRIAVCGIVLALTTIPRARAQSEEARAASRRHFESGEGHFKVGRFAEALVEYEAGYRLVPLPGFLINIAHCHRLTGELRKARANYRKFLLVEPASPRRREVEEIIVELDKAIAEQSHPATAPGPSVPKTLDPLSSRRWLWSAMAASIVGSTVAAHALAAKRDPQPIRRARQ